MGIHVYEVDAGLSKPRAVIVDSVTSRPLALPLFWGMDDAEGFLEFADGHDIPDPRRLTGEALEQLYSQWIAAGQPGAKSVGEEDDDDTAVGAPW